MRKAIFVFASAILAAVALTAQDRPQAKMPAAFDSLKTMVGTWESPSPEGGTTTNTIRLVSNGTAIEETFQSKQDNQMVTLYSPDGDRIAMVHFCSMGNQPRMETKATTANQKEFDFAWTGGTNIAGPTDAQMKHLAMRLLDKDHFDEVWTLSVNGKPQEFTFHFARKS